MASSLPVAEVVRGGDRQRRRKSGQVRSALAAVRLEAKLEAHSSLDDRVRGRGALVVGSVAEPPLAGRKLVQERHLGRDEPGRLQNRMRHPQIGRRREVVLEVEPPSGVRQIVEGALGHRFTDLQLGNACERHHSDFRTLDTRLPTRTVGTAQATIDTAATTAATWLKVIASVAATPNSIVESSRVAPIAIAMPAARPTRTNLVPWPITRRITFVRLAPSATRMPSSRARWLTEYITTA